MARRRSCGRDLRFGDHVLDRNDKQLIVLFKIHGNSAFGMEQDFVVLAQRQFWIVFDLSRNSNDAAGDRGNLSLVGQRDTAFGFAFGFVLADQDTQSDGFHVFESVFALGALFEVIFGFWLLIKGVNFKKGEIYTSMTT